MAEESGAEAEDMDGTSTPRVACNTEYSREPIANLCEVMGAERVL